MAGLDDYRCFIEPLETSGLAYCVTGSVAAGIYGEPRLTVDIDFVVLLKVRDIALFRSAFPEETYYIPPTEVLAFEALRAQRGMFNLIHHVQQVKADIFVAARDPLHAWALENRRREEMPGGRFWIAPPEYVILRKLEAYREGEQDKHLRDIVFMLASTPLDRVFLNQQLDRLGVHEQWQQARDAAAESGPGLIID